VQVVRRADTAAETAGDVVSPPHTPVSVASGWRPLIFALWVLTGKIKITVG